MKNFAAFSFLIPSLLMVWPVRVQGADGQIATSTVWLTPQAGQLYQPRGAEKCGNILLSPAGVPSQPRDQGRLGLCFAYAASDLVSQEIGEPVSAVDIAFSYYLQQGQTSVASLINVGGSVDQAVAAAAPKGFCEESALPSSGFPQASQKYLADQVASDSTLKVYIDSGNGWELLPDWLSGFNGVLARISDGRNAALAGDSATLRQVSSDLSVAFPLLSSSTLSSTIVRDKAGNDFGLANDIIDQTCGGRRKSFARPMHAESLNVSDQNSGFLLFSAIDRALNSGRMAAIAYDVSKVIDTTSSDGVKSVGFTEGGGSMWHASSIVGRRFNQQANRCEYLVRNSWGNRCDLYLPEIKAQCNNGQYWAPESYLQNALIGVYYCDQ